MAARKRSAGNGKRRIHEDQQARALVRERARSQELADEVAAGHAAQDRVKTLLERLVSVQEAERHRLARDLHDQLGQQLTALRLTLSRLKQTAGDALQSQLQEADAIAARLDQDVDYLAWALRPVALDEFGLGAALETLVRQWSKHHQIEARLAAPSATPRLPADVENHLYRIVQEALNNVFKHAHAREVVVTIEASSRAVHVKVQDDGRGFDITKNVGRTSMGLLGIRERVALIGGTLAIDSSIGRGTTISVRVPMPRDDQDVTQTE